MFVVLGTHTSNDEFKSVSTYTIVVGVFATRLEAVRVAVSEEVLHNLRCSCTQEHLDTYRDLIKEANETTDETLGGFENRWEEVREWFNEAENVEDYHVSDGWVMNITEQREFGLNPRYDKDKDPETTCSEHLCRKVDDCYRVKRAKVA